jgi:hypothetical protein
MKQQQLELQVADLEAQNAKLRAEIDNLQAPRPAPTIVDIIGPEAFDRMVELYPSFRESGTPTNPTDAASEVLWSCIRMMSRMDKIREDAVQRSMQATADYADIYARLERATNALAEFAMRAAEEADQ